MFSTYMWKFKLKNDVYCFVAIVILKQAATGDQFAVDQKEKRARKAELDELLKREVEEILRLRQVNTRRLTELD